MQGSDLPGWGPLLCTALEAELGVPFMPGVLHLSLWCEAPLGPGTAPLPGFPKSTPALGAPGVTDGHPRSWECAL